MQVSIRQPYEAGPHIREQRLAIGMDQGELADKSGVSRRHIVRLELAGPNRPIRPNSITLQNIGKVLGITFILEPGHPEVTPNG